LLDELKAAIAENLNQGYSKRVEQELNEQIFSTMIEKKDFEVPEAMVAFELESYLLLLSALALLATVLHQYISYGTTGVLANCGATCFSIAYLGLLSSFCVTIRIEFGLWHLLMFVFVVKCADIGAYAIGTLLGKHKFSPRIRVPLAVPLTSLIRASSLRKSLSAMMRFKTGGTWDRSALTPIFR